MKSFLFLLLFSWIPSAYAGLLVDLGGGYFSDSLTTTSTDSSVKYAYGIGIFFSLNKSMWGGWSYSGVSSQDTRTSTNNQLSGQDTGPTFKWQFGKGRNFCLGLTYNVLSRATYSTSSATEDWEGTGYGAQIAAMPEIKEGLRVGFAVNYYSVTYDRRKVNSVQTTVSYTRQWIYPSFMLTKEF